MKKMREIKERILVGLIIRMYLKGHSPEKISNRLRQPVSKIKDLIVQYNVKMHLEALLDKKGL